jgi:integration host factor subunit alpha
MNEHRAKNFRASQIKRAPSVGRDQLTEVAYLNLRWRSRREARTIVDQMLEEIIIGLVEDRTVLLSGFGAFRLAEKPERVGRNPKTGKEYPVSPRTSVSFRPSLPLRKMVAVADSGCAVGGSVLFGAADIDQ